MNARELKSSILQQAVSGKLVPQNPTDEPASVLLKKIRAEKERLVAGGKIKRDKNESKICRKGNSFFETSDGKERCIDEEIPFEIPESWEWARWGTLSESIQYGYIASAKKSGRIKMLRITDIQDGKVSWDSVPFCDIEEAKIPTYLLQKNDILFARTGSVGKSYLVTEIPCEAIYAGYLIRTRYSNLLCPQYLKIFMGSAFYWSQLRRGTITTVQPNCNAQTLSKMLLPIPPLSEQKRIVEKAEVLLALVKKYADAEKLLDETDADFPERLKKSVLHLAVQGKLVPQNPDDEPAAALLKKIRAEKNRLIAAGKIKREKHETKICRKGNSFYETSDGKERPIDDELPFEIPESWEWCRVGDLFTNMTGLSYKKESLYKKSEHMIRVLRGGNIGDEKYSLKDDDVFISAEFVKPDLPLKKGYMITPAVSSIDHIGKIALIDKDYDDVVAGGFVLILKPIFNSDIVSKYLLYAFATKDHRDNCRNITHKSGQAFYNLSREKMMNLHVPIPPLAEQKRIVEKIEELLPLIENLQRK